MVRRTKKWTMVAQEATRLAALGLGGSAIAKQLDVNPSQVTRWVQAGKLTLKTDEKAEIAAQATRQSPAEWAATIRGAYALDANDDQLVSLGEAALVVALDLQVDPGRRMAAAGRFQAVVKQLALITRAAGAGGPEAPAPTPPRLRVVRRTEDDPRRALLAANE